MSNFSVETINSYEIVFSLVLYTDIPGRKQCLLSTSYCRHTAIQVLVLNDFKSAYAAMPYNERRYL